MSDIKNFIPTYPNYDDENFTKKISSLKEFADYKLSSDEKVEFKQGEPLKHQELQARFFSQYTPYDKAILWQGTGTGKSCVVSFIVERFKNTTVNNEVRKQAIIVVKNESLANNFRKEISEVCTKSVYSSDLTESEIERINKGEVRSQSDMAKSQRLKKSISKTYKIMTYNEFININLDKVNKEYSNRLIILDEAHHIRYKSEGDGSTKYDKLDSILHKVKNCRIFLLTATPIWDKTYDIAGLANLILPAKKKFPLGEKFISEYFDDEEIKEEKVSEIREKFQGIVSYIRPLESNAKKIEEGVKEPWVKHIKVYPSSMSDFQYKNIPKIKDDGEDDDESNIEENFDVEVYESESEDTLLTKSKDASVCVYPRIENGEILLDKGEIGIEGFKNSLVDGKVKKGFKPELKKFLRPPGNDIYKNLRICSSKFATIIEMLKDPKRLNEKVFIYNESVHGAGGLLSMGLILQLFGFKWLKSIGEIRQEKIRTLNKDFPGSFIIISSSEGTIKDANITKALEFYNNTDNVYGQKIRIILGSKVISQGYTLKATRQGHIMSPHWNLSGIDQAMGRIFRSGSFTDLPVPEQYVKFYKHVSVKENPDDETVDVKIYKTAENKDYKNSQIHRIMKEVSWDCSLAYNRNVLSKDISGSRDCDYKECNYTCSTGGTEQPKEDPNNYNLLYSTTEVNELYEEIKKCFNSYYKLNFYSLCKLLNVYDDKYILVSKALNYIIKNHIQIRDRYGNMLYLKEDGDIYFLDIEPVVDAKYIDSLYTLYPVVVQNLSFKNVLEQLQIENDAKIIKKNPCLNPSEFEKLSMIGKIEILEYLIQSYKDIDLSKENVRKCINVVWESIGDELYITKNNAIIHNIYTSIYSETDYNLNTKTLSITGKMRIFDKEDGEWRYCNKDEEIAYLEEIKLQGDERKLKLLDNEYKMIGTSEDNKLRIFDNRENKARDGTICTSIDKTNLYNIMFHLNHLPSGKNTNNIERAKEFINNVKNKKIDYVNKVKSEEITSEDDISKIYTMLKMDKNELCSSIEEWFKENNLYYDQI